MGYSTYYLRLHFDLPLPLPLHFYVLVGTRVEEKKGEERSLCCTVLYSMRQNGIRRYRYGNLPKGIPIVLT